MEEDILKLGREFLHEVLPKTREMVTDVRLISGDYLQRLVTESGRVLRYIRALDFLNPDGVDFELMGIGHKNSMFYDDETLYGLMFPIPVRKRLPGRILIINDEVRDHEDEMPYLTDSASIESWMAQYNDITGELFYGDVLFFFLDAKAISCFHHSGHFAHTFFP